MSADGPTNGMATAGTATLREELHRLYALRPSLDTFCDEAIRLIVSEPAVAAAAVFTYASRTNQLTALTMNGLDEKSMSTVRASVGRTWDIPLRSIRNRRINVIDAAHENPFVPEAIKAIAPDNLTIASIPFYHANAAVGVAVLFSLDAAGFPDNVLRRVSQGLRVFGAAIKDLPDVSVAASQMTEAPSAGGGQPNLLRGLAALKTELVRLTTALEESERHRASEVAERVTAQSFLKAAQQRSERAEQELIELREKQKRIPELEQQGQDLDRRLQNATELAERAKTRVIALEESLEEKTRDNETKASELVELRAKRTQLERDLQRAGERATRHEQSAAELNAQLGRFDAIRTEAERLGNELEATTSAKRAAEERIAELETSLAAADAARDDLAKALTESKTELDSTSKERESLYTDALESWEKLEDIEKQQADLTRERESLASINEGQLQRIQELEAVRDALEAEKRNQATSLDQLAGQVETLDAQREHLREELERIRNESSHTISELREQVEQTDRDRTGLSEQIAALKRIEEERDRLVSRVEELEGDTRIARHSNQRLEDQLAQAKKESERLDIEKGALEMRIEVLAEGEQNVAREKNEAVAQLEAELQRSRQQLSTAEDALQNKHQELDAQLAEARSKAETALEEVRRELTQVNQQRDKFSEQLRAAKEDESVRDELLATAEDEQKDLVAQIDTLAQERATLNENLTEARNQLEESARLAAETQSRVAELEEGLRTLRDGDLKNLRAELESTGRSRSEAEEALAAAQERHTLELIDLQDRLAMVQQEKEQLAQTLDEKDQLLQSAEHGLTTLEMEDGIDADDEIPLEIDRSGIPEDDEIDTESTTETESRPSPPEAIVLLDDESLIEAAARQLTAIGHRVTSLKPEPESATKLAQSAFACAAINLAAPAAWPTLRKMRNGAGVPHSPMIAYALGQHADKGFWLGPVDFATLPVAESNVSELLSSMVPNLRRVIAMSHDFDVMEEVRAQLTAARISTAVVFDGRQVLDLVPTVKPQAAILHMSPNCTDVFRAVAGLRSQEETRDVPILFLLDEEAQPREESFVTAGIRMLSGRGTLVPGDLPNSLASALGIFQPSS